MLDLDGRHYSVDATDGAVSSTLDGPRVVYGDGSAPVFDGRTLYANELGVIALDPETMQERWSYVDNFVDTPPALTEEHVLAVGGTDSGELVALDPNSGDRDWTVSLPGRPRSVVVADGVAYALAGCNHEGVGPTAVAVDLDSHEELWRRTPASSPRSLAAVHNGIIVAGTSEGTLLALDAETGNRRWETRVNEDYQVWSSPTIASDTVYVGREGGAVVALDRDSGVEVWRYETPHPVQSNPSVVDGVCYVADNHGTVYALE